MGNLFTSESVGAGHPDKVADRISDSILDAALKQLPKARVAVETLVTEGLCVVAGETSGVELDYERIAREAIGEIGYLEGRFSASVPIIVRVHEQAREIGSAVEREGAGDQGLMFGYACDETPDLMPAPIHYAHRIVKELGRLRLERPDVLGPDAKSQVTVEYREGLPAPESRGYGAACSIPVRAEAVVVSQMHSAGLSPADLRDLLLPCVRRALPEGWLDGATRLYVNPAGTFVEGGPATDTGLTGRKIVVDTYGGAAPHGGGAFSGKDATKVDRSAAYAARYLAKNVVAAGLARRCLLQVAYAIGVAEPLALRVDCQGTARVPEARIEAALRELFSLTPRSIRERLGLEGPIYARTAAYGHFGRAPEADGGFSWERTDLVPALAKLG